MSVLNFVFSFRNEIEFIHTCNETLESLCEQFEEIIENSPRLDNPDITFSVSILYKKLGKFVFFLTN